jgi:hypothetical protein
MERDARNLDTGSRRILRAFVDAARPRGSGFDQEIEEDVLAQIDGFLPHLPRPMRVGLPVGLRLLEYGPPIFARPRRWSRMSSLPRDEAERYLEGWLEAGGLRGTLLLGLRTLLFLAFYQHPDVLESLDVDWEGRARELSVLRAELIREAGI